MNVQFLYEDGESNLLDEQGRPVIDEMDVEGLIPLEILTNLQIYKLAEESRFNAEAMQVNRTKQRNDENEYVHRHDEVESYGKSKRQYRMYTQQDREALFDLWTEQPGVPISKLARSTGIHPKSAQRWIKEYVDNNLEDIPSPKPRGKIPFKKLNFEQKVHIQELVDDNASITLSEMMNSLTTSFDGLKVSYSSLQRFVKDECCLSFKLIRREAIERNSESKIEQRYDYVKRLNDLNVDYCSNCIFIDEAGFNINMKRNFGWSTIGNTPVVKTPTTRSESRTILGAICIDGIVVLSLRKPKQLTQIKKRKLEDGEQEPITRGTVTAHYKQFLMDVMDELDKYPKFQNSFLVMDNASIHKNPSISRIIVGRGYRCLYLPPFSPELNPIEQFWHLVKAKLKRERFLGKDTLSARITEAANTVPLPYIQNCIRHSVHCFESCLEKKPL